MAVWNGDYDELYNLINDAWEYSYNDTPVFDFDKTFLKWFLESPYVPKDNIFCAYDKGKLISFVACINRMYRYNNKIIKGGFVSFLSIHPDYTGSRYSYRIVKELALKFQEDFKSTGKPEFVCFFLDENQGVFKLINAVGIKTGIHVDKISRMDLKVKILDMSQTLEVVDLKLYERIPLAIMSYIPKYSIDYKLNISDYDHKNINKYYNLMNASSLKGDFLPFWNQDELNNQLQYENFSDTLIYKQDNSVVAFINYRLIYLKGKGKRHKIAVIDWINDIKLTKNEKKQFINVFLKKVKSSGCVFVMYMDVPFLNNSCLSYGGFLPYPRNVNLTCFNYNPESLLVKNIKRPYELLF